MALFGYAHFAAFSLASVTVCRCADCFFFRRLATLFRAFRLFFRRHADCRRCA